MDHLFESARIAFRQVTDDDFDALYNIVRNPDVMYAWEHVFTRHEVQENWIDFIKRHYRTNGYCYYAAIEKETGAFLGLMGPLKEQIDGQWQMGLGYILDKQYWNLGLATEGARACMEYAFTELGAEALYAQIRPSNRASRQVAKHLGMEIVGSYDRMYRGQAIPHLIYRKQRPAQDE